MHAGPVRIVREPFTDAHKHQCTAANTKHWHRRILALGGPQRSLRPFEAEIVLEFVSDLLGLAHREADIAERSL